MNIVDCEPKSVFKLFRQISDIPREAQNETQICNFLVDFAISHGLDYYRDDSNNVIIRKPASIGYEDFPTVILQAHMDMVCVKREGSNHNFLSDPIDIIVDGDIIKAKDTTLGADNGIGLAVALAIIDENIPSPSLEIVVTSSEEIGLVGAQVLDKSKINGSVLINLDNSNFGELCVGSAGPLRMESSIPIEFEYNNGDAQFHLKISGLLSGHSGDVIDRERANAIILLGRILNELKNNFDLFLFDISGGSKMNLIPNIAQMDFSIKKENVDKLNDLIFEMQNLFSKEFAASEKNINISLQPIEVENKKCISQKTLEKLISCILLMPNGVINMSVDMKDLPNTSNNLGVLEINDKNIVFYSMVRSMTSSRKYFVADKIKLLFTDGKVNILTDIPAWDYAPDSKLNDILVSIYKNLFGETAQVKAIHGGLECNCFAGRVKYLVSIGADIFALHTVNEYCSIKSVQNLWKFVCQILQNENLKNLS